MPAGTMMMIKSSALSAAPAAALVLILTLSATVALASPVPTSPFGFSHQQTHQQQQAQQFLQHHQPQDDLVPSANIFTPAWLAQRRSRSTFGSVNSQNVYTLYHQSPQPQPFYQHQPRTSLYHAGTSNSGRHGMPMYHLVQSPHQPQQQQQYYQPSFEAMSSHARFPQPATAYYPTGSTGYILAPVMHVQPTGGDHHFAKRIDHQMLKPLTSLEGGIKPKPCLATAAVPLPSEHYPVYVLPPKNFQPIIYHHQQPLTNSYHPQAPVAPAKSAEELWYENGDNAGQVKYGGSGGNKLGTSDGNALEAGRPSNEYRKIYLVPVTSDQIGGSSFPVYEAVIREVAAAPTPASDHKSVTNAFNSQIEIRPHAQQSNGEPGGSTNTKVDDQQRRLKTKLPVGLTSFFLGGIRGVSGRHWSMPPALVKDLEFMPNLSPMSPENKYLPEESYVKKVDNGGDTAVASAGDPEKEDPVASTSFTLAASKSKGQATGDQNKNRKIFEGSNTIIDSPLDLETAESSSKQVINAAPASLPTAPVASSKPSIAKS